MSPSGRCSRQLSRAHPEASWAALTHGLRLSGIVMVQELLG